MTIFVAVPVKPFGVAKARLAPILDAAARRRLGPTVVAHTLEAATQAGGRVAVVTADADVARWAKGQGVEVVPEAPPGSGLNRAAQAAVAVASRLEMPWAIVHADLPLLRPDDLVAVFDALSTGHVALAPSHDRGSNVVAAALDRFPFSYGPDSFGRHLTAAARLQLPVRVLVRTRLALDLDGPDDLRSVLLHPDGAWMRAHLS